MSHQSKLRHYPLIAAATIDGYMVWDTISGEFLAMQPECGFRNGISDVSWVPNSRQLLTVGCSYKLQLWDIDTDSSVELDPIPTDSFTRIEWSPDGSRLASNHGSVIKIWGEQE